LKNNANVTWCFISSSDFLKENLVMGRNMKKKSVMWCFSRVFGMLLVVSTLTLVLGQSRIAWLPAELQAIRQIWIGSLGAEPIDPTNAVAEDARAATLGHKIFFDTAFSEDGSVACATCHRPEIAFADNNQLAEGRGTAARNTPTVIGSAFGQFQFWDGRSDSLWSQALGPMESAVEHGTNRIFVAREIFKRYRAEYEALFGVMENLEDATRFPTQTESFVTSSVQVAWDNMRLTDQQVVLRIFSNVGKAIAAYERLLRPAAAPFDQYAEAILETNDSNGLIAISEAAQAGLRLFIGKANCIACHSNALLNDQNFYNTGIPTNQTLGEADPGRSRGLVQLERSGFTCMSIFSDSTSPCQATRAVLGNVATGSENTATALVQTSSSNNSPDDVVEVTNTTAFKQWLSAFKTPSLRNVARTAPYMHAGQFNTLKQVVVHYNRALVAATGETQIKPLGLIDQEVEQIVAFLQTLNSGVDAPAMWLEPPH
jgi:cytochrome c peroxidase